MAAASRFVQSPLSRGASSSAVGGVTPSWLEARLADGDIRVLDVRADAPRDDAASARRERQPARRGPPAPYAWGHIPGAVALDVRAVLFDETGEVVSAPELAIAMSGLGVGDGHTIVLVDEARADAALAAAWALARYGHHDVHVLEGGFPRWAGEGRVVSREVVRHPPVSFTAKVAW